MAAKRPPDSRVTAGQQIEDALDAITDETRRRTGQWIQQLRRPNPHDQGTLGAIISGIAGGLLDEVWKQTGGDPDQMRDGWALYVESYLESMAQDQAADQEPT